MTELLARGREVGRAGAEAAPLLRYGQRGGAKVGQPPPEGEPGRQVAGRPRAGGGGRVRRSQEVVQRRRPGGRGRTIKRRGRTVQGRGRPRQAQHPLGDDGALDLVGAGVDRPGQREQAALEPAFASDLGPRAEQVERGLVERDVELRPEHLAHARLRPERPALGQPHSGRVGVQLIRAGADPRVRDPVGGGGVGRVAGLPPEPDQPAGRRDEPSRAAQRETAFVAGRAHRDPPAVARRADDVRVGHEHVVEVDLGEPGLAAELADRADRHPGIAQAEQQVRQAPMPVAAAATAVRIGARIAVSAGTEQPERPVGEGRARAPRLRSRQQPAAVGPDRAGPDGGQVAARLGLGPGLRPDLVRPRHRRQQPVTLLLGAVREQRRREEEEPVLPDPDRPARGVVRLLERQPLEQRRVPPAVLGRPGHHRQPGRRQRALPLRGATRTPRRCPPTAATRAARARPASRAPAR